MYKVTYSDNVSGAKIKNDNLTSHNDKVNISTYKLVFKYQKTTILLYCGHKKIIPFIIK